MEQTVLFEEKVFLSPKDMNIVKKTPLDDILIGHLKEKLEKKCSKHGYVIPGSLKFLSKSMGQLENGRFTGNIVFHVQAEGRVYNPVNGTRVACKVLKKNKMGLYGIYEDAIRILVPRDLHLGNELFDSIQVDQDITVEIRKSRFQLNDLFILSVGVLVEASAAPTLPANKITLTALPEEEQLEEDENTVSMNNSIMYDENTSDETA